MSTEVTGNQPFIVTIDSMRVRDLNEVLNIERVSFLTPWSRYSFLSELLENDRAYYLVARSGGRLVGYAGMWLIADEGHVTNIAVHPLYRGRGVGRQLMLAIEHMARCKGARRMTLEVRVSNTVARHLYEQLGYESAGIRPRYYRDNNEDAVIMWKDL